MITCTRESAYRAVLTRGKQYELLGEKDNLVRVRGDNGRMLWYSRLCFDMEGKPAPRLLRWKYDPPTELMLQFNLPPDDVTMQFDDGKYRRSILATPTSLKNALEKHRETGLWISHMIIVRSLDIRDIHLILSRLDRDGVLLEASKPLDFEEGEGSDHDGVIYHWHAAYTDEQYHSEVPYRNKK